MKLSFLIYFLYPVYFLRVFSSFPLKALFYIRTTIQWESSQRRQLIDGERALAWLQRDYLEGWEGGEGRGGEGRERAWKEACATSRRNVLKALANARNHPRHLVFGRDTCRREFKTAPSHIGLHRKLRAATARKDVSLPTRGGLLTALPSSLIYFYTRIILQVFPGPQILNTKKLWIILY